MEKSRNRWFRGHSINSSLDPLSSGLTRSSGIQASVGEVFWKLVSNCEIQSSVWSTRDLSGLSFVCCQSMLGSFFSTSKGCSSFWLVVVVWKQCSKSLIIAGTDNEFYDCWYERTMNNTHQRIIDVDIL